MTVAIVCTGLLGLLVFVLGFAVSITRARTDTVIGAPGDPADLLHKLVRAHGNSAEYAAILAVLFVVLGQLGPSTWMLWVMGIATVARYLHAIGMLMSPSLAQVQPLRFLGALGTYAGGAALSIGAIVRAL